MKTFVAAAIASVVASHAMNEMDYKFMEYVAKFGKSYATREEYEFRQ
jgi:hypothetical protein